MKRFFKDYRLHEYTEALFLLTLGIIIQVLDGSPLDLKQRWTLAWETEFPREFFSPFIQKIIKTVLSVIILVRCLTSVLYVLSGLIVIYCILRETSPKLMLPWLFISGLKSVLLTFLETLTGVYVCSSFGKVRKPCVEFVVSKAVELFFAIYLWACIRSIHKDMERFEEDVREGELLTKMVITKVNLRRRRARSMIDETTLYKTANLNYFELKDVPNIIFDMLKTEEELSQDSLLSPGMMLASVSNMGSYDYLKTSLSLGELGFIDLNSFQVVGLDDDRHLCPYKRAMKFLKLTRDDIQKAKELTRRRSFVQNYAVPEEIHWSALDSKLPTILSRHPRQEEVFVAQLPDPGKVKEILKKKKQLKLHRDDIFGDFDASSEEESRGSFEKIIGLQEGDGNEEEARDGESFVIDDETDADTTPDLWFMTNKKDEVNRIGLFETHAAKRADNYERLYQQDFMSVVGPEVFEKASKLVKLTSLSDINAGSSAPVTYPSTSRDPDLNAVESHTSNVAQEEQARTQKTKKKIAFEDRYENHTTMPLSIIVAKYPVQLDDEISKFKTLYFRDPIPNSSGILFLSDSGCKESSEKCGTDATGSEAARKTKTAGPESDGGGKQPSSNQICRPSKRTRESLRRAKLNFYLLRYFDNIGSDFRYNRSNARRFLSMFKGNESKLCELDFDAGLLRSKKETLTHLRRSEQMIFMRDLVKRPIRDVLKSYYDLRGLNIKYSKHLTGELPSKSSIRIYANKKKTPPKKVSEESRKSDCGKYFITAYGPGEKRKSTTERGTQVYFGGKGLGSYTSVEAAPLDIPKTEKMETGGNDSLPSLYLFGDKDLDWSSSPMSLAGGKAPARRSRRDVTRSDYSNGQEQESSAANSGLEPKKDSDISCKLVLPPRHTSSPNKEICSPGQNVSVEIIPKCSEPSIFSSESEESFSLFYSKTADLASPLLDMKRFIYPDHIHYSYKNVNKKGFDVELNGGLPLLVRDSLTLKPLVPTRKIDSPPDSRTAILRRPMNLDFLESFGKPQKDNSETSPEQTVLDEKSPEINPPKMNERTLPNCGAREKKMQKWFKKFGRADTSRFSGSRHTFANIADSSSIHLHTNKARGRVVSSPVTVLQNNKDNKKNVERIRYRTTFQGHASFYP